jgi:hypothetical protein
MQPCFLCNVQFRYQSDDREGNRPRSAADALARADEVIE